jgi:hypothetical protein
VSAHAWQGTCCQPEGACTYQHKGTTDVQVNHSQSRRTGQHMHGSCCCCLLTQQQQRCNCVNMKSNLPRRDCNTESTACARSGADCRHDAKAKATDVLAACTAAWLCSLQPRMRPNLNREFCKVPQAGLANAWALVRTCSPGAPAGCLSSCHPSTSQAHGPESQATPEAWPGRP